MLGTLKNFEKISVLGLPVLEDFEKFQKIPKRDFPPMLCGVCGF